MKLVTDYIGQVEDEEGRQELFQVVQYWRSQVPDLRKDSLAKIASLHKSL